MKKYFIIISILLSMPFISSANLADTVKLLGQVRAIESSAGVLADSPSVRQALDDLYQNILNSLKDELVKLQTPQTTSVSFNTLNSPFAKGSLQVIPFNRLPAETSSSVNFSVETSAGGFVGVLANSVTSNSIQWQVAENFVVGRDYIFVARNDDNVLLGRSEVFVVSSSTVSSTPSIPVVSLPVISAADIASADVNRSSIGYWSFDKYSNNCDTKGGALIVDDGKVGAALTLNGTDAYCYIYNNRTFYPKNFTLALWAKSSFEYSSGWNDSNWFISLRDQSGFIIGPVKGSKDVQFTILDDTNLTQVPYVVGTVTPDNITNWHHYAMTYDGITAKVYLDGTLVTSTTTSIVRNYAGIKNMFFGLDDASGQPYGAGALDEIRIYNRPLTTCEIQLLAGKDCGSLSGKFYGNNNLASIFSIMEATLLRLSAAIQRGR